MRHRCCTRSSPIRESSTSRNAPFALLAHTVTPREKTPLGHRLPHAGVGPLRHGRGGSRGAGQDPRRRLRGQPDQVPRSATRAAEAPHRGVDQRPQRGGHTEGVVGMCLKVLDGFRYAASDVLKGSSEQCRSSATTGTSTGTTRTCRPNRSLYCATSPNLRGRQLAGPCP